jgi:hypothetical protein
LNPNWTVTATVHNAVLNPTAGIDVDTVTWKVLSAADGARCKLFLTFDKNGSPDSNATVGLTYHTGGSNTAVSLLSPDHHAETAAYTLGCSLNGGAEHWATSGTISIE